jgi:hypothetical protein
MAKVFSIAVAVILGVYGVVGFYFLPLAGFEGDLTRMANLPESYFGWTLRQPSIDSALMKSASWHDADVLAIGDSYTTAQIWQSRFAERGVRVRTETWESMFNLCENFADWMRSKGFKGKYIVIESADKYLGVRLARSAGCKEMNYHPLAEVSVDPPATSYDRQIHSYSGRLSIGIRTELNVLKYNQLSRSPDFKSWDDLGEVRLERITNGCELFSHPRCQDVLFYNKDRIDDLGENVLNDMARTNARMNGYSVIWVVIPDKATVYLHPDKQFWDKAEQRFHAPNVLKTFRREIEKKTVDLYRGNNTHISTTGYLVLGNLVYQSIY